MKQGLIGLLTFGLGMLSVGSNAFADLPSIDYHLLPKVSHKDYTITGYIDRFCTDFYIQRLESGPRGVGFVYPQVNPSGNCIGQPVAVWIDSDGDGEVESGEIFSIDYSEDSKKGA